MVTKQDIGAAVQQLGLSGLPVCVHSSLHSFGGVEGGPGAVVDGFLEEGVTLLVPTFSGEAYEVGPPPHLRPARNGIRYDEWSAPVSTAVFDTSSLELDVADMGAISATVLRSRPHARGNHPICSFTATGPLAEELVAGQSAIDVFAPLREVARRGGYVILMGVGFECLTLLHAADEDAGRQPFMSWANGPGGVIGVMVGGCSLGFPRLQEPLAWLQRTRMVGSSPWTVLPAARVLEEGEALIRRDPSITHWRRSDCPRCDDAVAGGPIL